MAIPITARGAKMLKDELHRLKTQDRPAVVQAIAEAREKGDLSENAEYDAARESQAFIEGRIMELESKISQFQVIDPTTLPNNGRVVFSATVTIEDVETGDRSALPDRGRRRKRHESRPYFHRQPDRACADRQK